VTTHGSFCLARRRAFSFEGLKAASLGSRCAVCSSTSDIGPVMARYRLVLPGPRAVANPMGGSLADAFEQLGFGAENGTWRSVYLAGATELRRGNFRMPTATAAADLIAAFSPAQLFDDIAIRVDGPLPRG
jgi:hypothetical protein